MHFAKYLFCYVHCIPEFPMQYDAHLTFVCSDVFFLFSRAHAVHSCDNMHQKNPQGKGNFHGNDQNDEKKNNNNEKILNRKQFLWIFNAFARQVCACVRVCAMEQKQTAHIWH